jgi:hypothetical protein
MRTFLKNIFCALVLLTVTTDSYAQGRYGGSVKVVKRVIKAIQTVNQTTTKGAPIFRAAPKGAPVFAAAPKTAPVFAAAPKTALTPKLSFDPELVKALAKITEKGYKIHDKYDKYKKTQDEKKKRSYY